MRAEDRSREDIERSRKRRYDANGLAGCVQQRRARENGVLVGVYDADDAGMESDPSIPWATVCELHGSIVCHSTLAAAKYHASKPTSWCDCCRHVQDGKCDDCGNPAGKLTEGAVCSGSCACHEGGVI